MASESDVLSALAAYREHIGGNNHRVMSALIPQIESVDMDEPDIFESPEEEEGARLGYVSTLLGIPEGNTQPPIERPSDVLEYWDVLAPQLALDGASVHPDPVYRTAKRKAYTSAVLRGLEPIECPTGTWTFPRDFEVVMQNVDTLEGPGWSLFREQGEHLIFWEGCKIDDKRMGKKCETGQEIMNNVGIKYDVAGGWACGYGNESVCYIMYSRLKGATDQDWSWRYVANLGQFGIEIFDDVKAVLGWYQGLVEPTESDFEITAEEVFAP
ncbi:hypothetical protein F4818DRAFT_193155 [Hypoxylon cercidicola]|nr:hypothetical protein F4818DRAFT_193155 [Hypoxylon cercidicola]